MYGVAIPTIEGIYSVLDNMRAAKGIELLGGHVDHVECIHHTPALKNNNRAAQGVLAQYARGARHLHKRSSLCSS